MEAKVTFKQGFSLAKGSFKLAFKNKFKILGFNILAFIPMIFFLLLLGAIINFFAIDIELKNMELYKQILIEIPFLLALAALSVFAIITPFIFAKKLTNNEIEKISFNSIKEGLKKSLSIKLYAAFVLFFVSIFGIVQMLSFVGLNEEIMKGIIVICFLPALIVGMYALCFVANEDCSITCAIKSALKTFKNNFLGILGGFIYRSLLTSVCYLFIIIIGALGLGVLGFAHSTDFGPITASIILFYSIIGLIGLALGLLILIFMLSIMMSYFVFVTKVCKLNSKN